MKILLLGVLFLLAFELTAQAQIYLCGFSGTLSFDSGVGVSPNTNVLTRRDLLAMVAATDGRSLDPATLKLVFDASARQFHVVKTSDGSLVAVVYALTNEQQVPLASGGTIGVHAAALEQADLLEPGTSKSVGTIAGSYADFESYPPTGSSERVLFWGAKFSVLSQTGGVFSASVAQLVLDKNPVYAHLPMLIQGQFKVHGAAFVPKGK